MLFDRAQKGVRVVEQQCDATHLTMEARCEAHASWRA